MKWSKLDREARCERRTLTLAIMCLGINHLFPVLSCHIIHQTYHRTVFYCPTGSVFYFFFRFLRLPSLPNLPTSPTARRRTRAPARYQTGRPRVRRHSRVRRAVEKGIRCGACSSPVYQKRTLSIPTSSPEHESDVVAATRRGLITRRRRHSSSSRRRFKFPASCSSVVPRRSR